MTATPARLFVLAGIVLLVAGYALTSKRDFNFDRDNAIYFGLAGSLAAGAGYEFNRVPHTQYPPGAAILLAPVHAITGGSEAAMYGYVGLWGAAAILLAFFWFRRREDGWALPLAFLLVLSPDLFNSVTGGPVAGALYTTLSLGVLAWSEHVGRQRATTPMWLLGVVLVLGALLTHSTGIALVAALGVSGAHQFLASERDRESTRRLAGTAVVLAMAVAAQLSWMAWSRSADASFYPGEFTLSYIDQLLLVDARAPDLGSVTVLGALMRPFTNVMRDLAHVVGLLTNVEWLKPIWFSPPIAIAALLCALGIARELKRPNPLAAWYGLAYFGLVTLWPYNEGRRLLIPVLPVLLLLAAGGTRAIVDWFRRTAPRRAAITVAVVSGAILLGGTLQTFLRPESASMQDFASLAAWALLAVGSVLSLLVPGPKLQRIARPVLPLTLAGYVLGFCVLGAPKVLGHVRANVSPEPLGWNHYHAVVATDWLRENTEAGDRVMAQDYAQIHYETGLQVVPLPITGRASTLVPALQQTLPRYVVINAPLSAGYYLPEEVERLAAIQRELPGALSLAHEHEQVSIYRYAPAEGRDSAGGS